MLRQNAPPVLTMTLSRKAAYRIHSAKSLNSAREQEIRKAITVRVQRSASVEMLIIQLKHIATVHARIKL